MPQELRPRVIPIPYRKFFWELHISETILSILTKLCPNVPWVILFQSYVWYVWGPKKGPRGGLRFIFCPLKLDDILNSLYITYTCWKIFPIHHTCMTCLFFSFLLIYKTRPIDFDLQLGCCISDAFSIFVFLIDNWPKLGY
jgi:hypothetical protein